MQLQFWNMSNRESNPLNGIVQGEYLHHRKDGSSFWIESTVKAFFDESGRISGYVSVVCDITERKQLEEQTRRRAEEMETIMEVAPVAIGIGHDPQCHNITGNRMANELYEAEVGENISANVTQTRRFFYKGCELTAEELPMQQAALKDINVRNVEFDVLLPSGERRALLGSASTLHDADGSVRGSIGAFMDITERKEAEIKLKETLDNLENLVKERTEELEKAYNSLKESERGLAEAQKMAHLGNWDWNIVTDEIYCSDEIYRIFGYKPQEFGITYNVFLNHVHPDDRDYVDNTVKEALNGKPHEFDFRIISASGEERIIHEQGEVLFNEKNNPARVRGIVQDITEQKRSEEKIRDLANIVKSSNDAIITESLDYIITSWNRGAEQIYGYSAEEILGKPISILEPSTLVKETEKLAELIKQGESIQQYETLRLRKDGKIIHVSITFSPVFDIHGKLAAISVVSRDITKRKEAENALTKIETTRKKEIHHRIKNNLQVISSLLDLQAEKFNNKECIKDSEVLEAFRESQDRVISIALIHEELHEDGWTDTLNFSLYLQRLIENLFETYRLGNADISLKTDIEKDIFFDMDIAVPLGITVNELVSNSLKHAFPGERGTIQIKLFSEEFRNDLNDKEELTKDTAYTLIVSDNGAGIPEKIDFENPDTLGLQLVAILVDQLDGEIELKRDKDTEFKIRFNVQRVDYDRYA